MSIENKPQAPSPSVQPGAEASKAGGTTANLIEASNCHTISCGWMQENWFWVLVYGLIFLYFVARLILLPQATDITDESRWGYLIHALRLPLGILFAAVFVHLFSDRIPLPPAEGLAEDEKRKVLEKNRLHRSLQRRNWMIFAFGFMLLSLLTPIYVFSVAWDKIPGLGASATNSSTQVAVTPLAVFVGCALDDGRGELSCKPTDAQKSTDAQKPADAQKSTDTQKQGDIQKASKGKNVAEPKKEAEAKASTNDKNPSAKSAWALNIGGYVTNASQCLVMNANTVCQVRGGLLVPLYVIILALLGGSISLTRRLPEYQKRASPEYAATETEAKLSQHEFREYLVFQMVQFISAPLIAILAYYLIAPSTTQAAVALAFTAGFASESILLMVRAVAEKLAPTSPSSKTNTGTIAGVVVSIDADGKETLLKNTEVSLAASSHVRAITDKYGFYILSNVPIGEHGIKVSPEKNIAHLQSISGSVKIERALEVVQKNWELMETAVKKPEAHQA